MMSGSGGCVWDSDGLGEEQKMGEPNFEDVSWMVKEILQ